MTTIETEKHIINKPAAEVFEFLSDCRNYEQLFPADRISNWEADRQHFTFRIQGTATIDLSIEESNYPNRLQLQSGEKAPFDFTLQFYIDDIDEATEAFLVFEGDINPMLRAMIQKPLTNLFEYMGKRLKEVMAEK